MQRLIFTVILGLFFSGGSIAAATQKKTAQKNSVALRVNDLPPLVFLGSGRLECTISSKDNGRQQLKLTAGAGVDFDISVTPILDGILEIKDGRLVSKEADVTDESKAPQRAKAKGARSLNYRFTSNLAHTRNFRVSSFGPVALEHMETRVSVNARRFRQEGGPGTTVSFNSDDMDKQGVYIEFRGIFREKDTGKRHAFRTVMGPPSDGSGQVTPLDSNNTSRIEAKTVMAEVRPTPSAPFTQITTTIREMDDQ